MTTLDIEHFSKVLASLEDKELKECLLMISDELPEKGANILRKLARREEGLYPIGSNRLSKDKLGYGWGRSSRKGYGPKINDPCRVPDNFIVDETDPFNFMLFDNKEEAWKYLLERLVSNA